MTRPHTRHLRLLPPPRAELKFTPSRNAPTLGERLVAFFRANGETLSFLFAMGAIVMAVGIVIGAYAGWGK